MRIVLVNVPHTAIGSRIPDDHLPPLGLLAIGGPLIDDGHAVELIDAEFGPMPLPDLVAAIVGKRPDAVLFGHSGSTSAHPTIARVSAAVARRLPEAAIVYGGVFPTYHWREILAEEPHVRAIVRGEGEETARRLMRALADGTPLAAIPGLAYREGARIAETAPAPVIRDLDAYRVGWELIDHARYGYWGGLRGVVVQFSRGAAHICATIAASAASGRAGATATRSASPPRSPGCTASTASGSSTSPTRTRPSPKRPGAPSSRR